MSREVDVNQVDTKLTMPSSARVEEDLVVRGVECSEVEENEN